MVMAGTLCCSACVRCTGSARQLSSTAVKLARVTTKCRSKQLKDREEKKLKRYGHVSHVPVMMKECMEHLVPVLKTKESTVVDFTFGGGGHTSALLGMFSM